MCLTNFACWICDATFEKQSDSEHLISTWVDEGGSNLGPHIYIPAHGNNRAPTDRG